MRALALLSLGLGALIGASFWGAAHAQPLSGGDSGPVIAIWRIIAAFVLCAGLAVAVIFALRSRLRLGRGVPFFTSAAQRRLHIVEQMQLSAHSGVALVRCDDQEFLIGYGPQGAQLVDRWPVKPDDASP